MSYHAFGSAIGQSLNLPQMPACVPKDVAVAARDWCAANPADVRGLGASAFNANFNVPTTWPAYVAARGFDLVWQGFAPCEIAKHKQCMVAAPPPPPRTCLTRKMISTIMACNESAPKGDPVAALKHVEKCSGLPLSALALELCPSEPPAPVPQCLDDQWAEMASYCGQYPAFNGPRPTLNTMCWGASRDSAWYRKILATPPCRVATVTSTVVQSPPPPPADDYTATVVQSPPPPPADDYTATVVQSPPPPPADDYTATVAQESPPPSDYDVVVTTEDYTDDGASEDDSEEQTGMSPVVIGGILLLVAAAAGGIYYYSSKKP